MVILPGKVSMLGFLSPITMHELCGAAEEAAVMVSRCNLFLALVKACQLRSAQVTNLLSTDQQALRSHLSFSNYLETISLYVLQISTQENQSTVFKMCLKQNKT